MKDTTITSENQSQKDLQVLSFSSVLSLNNVFLLTGYVMYRAIPILLVLLPVIDWLGTSMSLSN